MCAFTICSTPGHHGRQAGTSCDELKDLGGWKSRNMVDRYAKFATGTWRARRQGSNAASTARTLDGCDVFVTGRNDEGLRSHAAL